MNESLLEGHLDEIQRGLIRGWTFDTLVPDARVSVLITADGVLLGRVLANRYRPHVHAAGQSDGRHGFELSIVPSLSPLKTHVIAVRREQDGAHVPGSPVALAATTEFNAATQGQLAELLLDAADLPELEDRLDFLAAQTEALLQRHATLTGSATAADRLDQLRFRHGETQAPPSPPGRTVLLVAEAMPRHDDDDAAHTACALHALGLDVSLVATDRPSAAPPDLPAILYHAPWVVSVEEVLARQSGKFDAVVLDTASLAIRYAGLIRHHQPQALLLLMLPHGLRHHALAVQAHDEQQPDLLDNATTCLAHELRAIRDVDVVIGDMACLAHLAPDTSSVPDLEAAFSQFRFDTE